ncbi:transposase [Patescibacteria group bacterium]|nr:transposase [Patescibacteria group bacterium]
METLQTKKINKKIIIKKDVRRSYKFRAYPNKGTEKRLKKTMEIYAEIWNKALEERKQNYEARKKDKDIKPITQWSQYHLIRKKDHPEFKNLNAQSMQYVLVQLDSSYKSFFNKIKKDKSARPPKIKKRLNALTYGSNGWKLIGNILLINIGKLRIRLHRPVEGKIKTVTIRLKNNKWYVSFSIIKPLYNIVCNKNKKVKIDFPDYLFLEDSYGNKIKHPEFYFNEINELRRLSRALSRKEKGSKNYKKAKYTLHKWHEKISNKRKYFLWEIANKYTKEYDKIEVPKVPLKKKIEQATNSRAAQRLCDAAYGIFVETLHQKAEENQCNIIEYTL